MGSLLTVKVRKSFVIDFLSFTFEFIVGAVSDGPVFVHVNDTTFIYGFTGDFETDCNSSRPGMFMKISEIAEWIESIIL